LQETPDDIADIYTECCAKNADVVKLVTAARTPEEAWPLVQIVAKHRVPTVVVGVGKPGIMLTILGKRVGAPWAYAALERGMETYPGQATVHDLESVYHYRAIEKGTRFVGVTGFDETQRATVAVLNAAFASLGLSARCLPIQVGSLPVFRKLMAAPWLAGVAIDASHRGALCELASELESSAEASQAIDLLLHKDQTWHGCDTLGRAAVTALEATLQAQGASDKPLQGRMVLIVGLSATGRSLAHAVKHRGGILLLASRQKEAATRLARDLGGRIIPFDAVYSTTHDVLIVCNDEPTAASKAGAPEGPLHPGVLRPNTGVLDLTALPLRSALAREAMARACVVVPPRQVMLQQLQRQVRLITGKQVSEETLMESLTAVLGEEE
jgi:shikimate 5-dehydrogenase